MELTKEHFEKTLSATEKRIISRIDDAQEELAVMTKNGFEDVLDRLDVRERMLKLETDMAKIKTALHLS